MEDLQHLTFELHHLPNAQNYQPPAEILLSKFPTDQLNWIFTSYFKDDKKSRKMSSHEILIKIHRRRLPKSL